MNSLKRALQLLSTQNFMESSQFSAKLIKPEKMAKKPVYVIFCPRLYMLIITIITQILIQ